MLVAVGTWMIFSDEDDREEQPAGRLLAARGLAMVAIGVSISLDELAIGFTLGLAHLPVVPVIAAIGVQALVACQLGLAVGAGIAEVWRDRAEKLAGVMFVMLGPVMAVQQFRQ